MSLETFNINTANDAYSTLRPVNWCLKIFALCSVKRDNNILVSNYSSLKALSLVILLGILNVILLIFKIKSLNVIRHEGPVTFTDFTQFVYIYGYIEYVVSVYWVHKSKQCCLNYFKIYNNIDSILGVTYAPLTRKIIVKNFCLFVNLCIFTSLLDYVFWSAGDWFLTSLYSADYIYALLNLLSLIDFISQIVLVEFRLKLIRNFLHIYYANSNPNLGSAGVLKDAAWMVELIEIKINTRLNNLRTLNYNDCIEISSFTKCYLMLLEQIIYLNNAYGIRVLLYCWNVLYNMISLINVAIRVSTGVMRPEETPDHWYLPAITSVIALINLSGMICMLLYRCESCYRHTESLIRITDLILQNRNMSVNAKAEFQEFRNLVTSRPIRFHAANFFNLDYTLLISGTTMVITYAIIMLQSVQ